MAHPLLSFVSLLLVAGGIVLQFFVILSGGINSSPLNHVYFLEAATNGIPNARNPSRWTYWAICAVSDGLNADCGRPVPALPFSPTHRTNFATAQGVPKAFVGTHKFYYLSRFAWVFYLLALLFAVTALLTGMLALCTRFGAYLSSLNAFIALFWQTLAASLMTAWTVQARNVFLANNQTASLGRYAYGFTWGAVACLLFATVLFCAAGSGGRSRRRSVRSSKEVSYA